MNNILEKAVNIAVERNLDLCIASTTGNTAKVTLDVIDKLNYTGRLVVVTTACGAYGKGIKEMSDDAYKELCSRGAYVVTAAHALSGCERGLTKKYSGIYPVEIIADSLRMLGQGVKVCVEISLMANDAGLLKQDKPVVCVAGSGSGADTICIITPAYSATVLDTVVNEIIEKPNLYQ
ncbi:MAG: pyruvate kinase alpha/beta domain-containing protein [Acutalibacteraceae bacterium]